MLVDKACLCQTAYHDLACRAVFGNGVDGAEFLEFYAAVALGYDRGIGCGVAGDTAGVERTERKLRTRFTDRLRRDNADGFAFLHHAAGGKVAAVALHADAVLAFAGEDGADFYAFDGRCLDFGGNGFGNFFAGGNDELARGGVDNVVNGNAAENALAEGGNDFVAVFEGGADETAQRAAVFLGDDDIVGNVYETAGEVTGVGRLQGGIGKTLTGTVRRDKVLEHGHAFLEV